jgi:hypothetical protein
MVSDVLADEESTEPAEVTPPQIVNLDEWFAPIATDEPTSEPESPAATIARDIEDGERMLRSWLAHSLGLIEIIHGERTDWIPRARHILAGEIRPFEAFDRTAQFTASESKSLGELLQVFADLRRKNIAILMSSLGL